MLGARSTQLASPAAKIVAAVAFFVFAISWLMGITRGFWASPLADTTHPQAIRFRGGTVLYFSQSSGWFLGNSVWIVLFLLGSALAIEFVVRRQRRADV